MITLFKKRIVIFVEFIHLRIFGHEIGVEMKNFLVNLSWSFLSGSVVMGTMVLILTLAGRLMGPTEYGRYNLLTIISQFLVIFVFLGLDISTVKSIAKSKSIEEKQNAIYSTFVFVLTVLVAIMALGLIFGHSIAAVSGLTYQFILLLVVYTFAVSIKAACDCFVRGLEEFKTQSKAKIFEMILVAAFFIAFFIFFGKRSFGAYTLVVSFGAIGISLYYLLFLKRYFRNFSLAYLKKAIYEGKFFMLSALLATIFLSSDRLIIAKFMDLKVLGIYSAYYTASFGIASQIALLVTNVFLPASAKTDDKLFTKKLDKLFLVGFLPFFIGACLLLIVALAIFGKDYPLRLDYLLLFGLFSALYFFQALYNTIILDLPPRDYKLYFILSNLVNFLIIGYYISLVVFKILSVDLILLGLIANMTLLIVIQKYLITKMRNHLPNELRCAKII